jgi:hypothetical protein
VVLGGGCLLVEGARLDVDFEAELLDLVREPAGAV